MRLRFFTTLIAAALLAGCATSTTPVAPGAAVGSSVPPAPPPPSLADEQKRLADALAGTPVVVELTPEGRLHVQVPMAFSFDVGRAAVKPPLAAVLDRIASGLKTRTTADIRLAAPADPKGAGGLLLAQDRAGAVRDYLVARGVPATRFGPLTRADNVDIVIGDKPLALR